jgi:hypothetical protein
MNASTPPLWMHVCDPQYQVELMEIDETDASLY